MKMNQGLLYRTNVKDYESHKKHFTDRLFERYGLTLKEGEYEEISNPCKKRFKGIMSKNTNNTVGYVDIQEIRVYVLYHSGNGIRCLATCYPVEVGTDLLSALKACFGSTIRKIALMILEEYINESDALPNFKDDKEAGIYLFSQTLFPQLHMGKYKFGKVDTLKVMVQINRVITNAHPYVKLGLAKRPIDETELMHKISYERN